MTSVWMEVMKDEKKANDPADMPVKQAVILAGGQGTRLRPFTETQPKPMYPFLGKPFIEYLILQVKSFGISDILILLGYLAETIREHLKDGSAFDVRITYDITPVEYNTGERLANARPLIDSVFLLLYCDNYCPIDFVRLTGDYKKNQAMVQLSAYGNRDGYTKSNLLQEDGKVIAYDRKRETPDLNSVDIGYAIVDREVLNYVDRQDMEGSADFEAVVYPRMAQMGKLYVTVTEHRYYSVGSWERLSLTRAFFAGPPAIFLDRDGTVNRRAPQACYIESPDQFIWLEGAMEAVKRLKEAGYRIILVTNQPGIARGRLTENVLAQIHRKMQEDLKQNTGYTIDAIYYCPHGWDEGCECRKPKPGMLYQAQRDFSLDLSKCFMIGDDDRDMEAGRSAGCKCIKVSETYNLLQAASSLAVLFNERGKVR